jgi:hypothetical protein
MMATTIMSLEPESDETKKKVVNKRYVCVCVLKTNKM